MKYLHMSEFFCIFVRYLLIKNKNMNKIVMMMTLMMCLVLIGCNDQNELSDKITYEEVLKKSIFDELTLNELNIFYQKEPVIFKDYQTFKSVHEPKVSKFDKAKYHDVTINRFVNFFQKREVLDNSYDPAGFHDWDDYNNELKKIDEKVYELLTVIIYKK
jgi:hypothetical protein